MQSTMTFRDNEATQVIMKLAKEGNAEAQSFLRERYNLKVFTQREIDEVNALIESGVRQEEAIKQVAEGGRDESKSEDA